MKEFSKEFLAIQPYDEIEEKFKCLECGNWYMSLAGHVRKHKISVAEYKERHGINKRQALVNERMRLASSKTGKEIGIKNISPAPKGVGLMKGLKNPKRVQTLAGPQPNYKEMARTLKKNWVAGKYDYLRTEMRKREKKWWAEASQEDKDDRISKAVRTKKYNALNKWNEEKEVK